MKRTWTIIGVSDGGGKVVGVRVALPKANAAAVRAMLRQAYEYKSSKPAARTARKQSVSTSGRRRT